MKKLLALVLALVMTLSLCTVSNAAYSDAADVDYKEAVDVMSAVGVFQGADGKFSPKAELTREQAAKLVAYLNLGEKVAEALPAVKVFNDVEATRWSAKYVAYCADAGYLAGVGNGNFDPAGKLTGYAFGKMLLCVLGYSADYEGFTGSDWAINVSKLANKLELFDGVEDMAGSAVVTREEAAQYCLNALQRSCVDYDGSATVIEGNGIKVTAGKPDLVTLPEGNSEMFGAGKTTEIANTTLELGEKLFGTKLLLDTSTDKFGRTANYWQFGKILKDVGKYANQTADYTYVVPASNAPADVAAVIDKVVNSATTDPAATAIYLNGYCDNTTAAAAFAVQTGDIVELFMSKTTANTVAKAVVIRYTADVVATNPDTNVTSADKAAGVTAYTSFKISGATKDTEVPGFDAETYVKDAIVATAVNGNTNAIVDSYVMTPVTGAITAHDGSAYYTMNGTKQYLSDAATDNVNFSVDFKAGNYSLYTDKNGFVLYTKVNSATAAIEDVYYVVTTYAVQDTAYGTGGNFKYYAQCVALDGTTKNIEISVEQFAGLVKVASPTGNPSSSSYLEVDTTSATGKKASTDTSVISTKTYYTAGTAMAAGLYTFETVTDETYMKAVAYAPTTGAYKAATEATDTAFTAKTTNWNGYKVSADTKLILVKGTKADLSVKVCTGPVELASGNFNSTPDNQVIYTKDANGNKLASYIVIPTTSNTLGSVASSDLLYCGDNTATNVVDGKEFTMYKMTGEKVTIFVKTGKTTPSANTFYDYKIATDGSYEISAASAAKDLDDSTSLITYGYVNNIQFAGLFGTKVSAGDLDGDSDDFIDVEAKDAVIVDLRDASTIEGDTYKIAITSLDKLYAAYQKGEVAMDVFASKDNGIEVIFVRSVGAYTVTGVASKVSAYINEACTVAAGNVTAGATVYYKLEASTTVSGATGATLVSGTANTTGAVYKFTMPNADVTLSAT